MKPRWREEIEAHGAVLTDVRPIPPPDDRPGTETLYVWVWDESSLWEAAYTNTRLYLRYVDGPRIVRPNEDGWSDYDWHWVSSHKAFEGAYGDPFTVMEFLFRAAGGRRGVVPAPEVVPADTDHDTGPGGGDTDCTSEATE